MWGVRARADRRAALTSGDDGCHNSPMFLRALKHLAVLSFAGAGLALASCSSTGFAGSVYMSPDQDGKRTETVFFEDAQETPAIYFIVPIVSGKNDESLNITLRVKSVFGVDVTKIYKPFLVASLAPGVQNKPTNINVQFPDPPPIIVPNPADPNNPLKQPQDRAVGKYQFIASMNGDTQAVNFEILPRQVPLAQDPNAGTPDAEPPPGACSDETIAHCPPPVGIDPSANPVICCTADGVCGIGVRGTGLCDPGGAKQ